MHKIIVYSSKHGAVKEIAAMLQEKCKEVEMHDIQKGDIDIQNYETVIIGTNVTASKISKELKEFCKKPELLDAHVILFVSGILKDITEVVKLNFSVELQEKIVYKCNVGGKLKLPEMSFFERNLVKVINKKEKFIDNFDKNKCYDLLDYESIGKLITKINEIK